MVISGFRWLSDVIVRYQCLLFFILGYCWLSVVIVGYTLLSAVILGYQWLSWFISGYCWLSIVNVCYSWLLLVILCFRWLSEVVAQEALRSKAPLVEYIPYHCGIQGNTYIPQEVVLLPGGYIYRPGSHAHFLGNIYILQEVS